MSTWEHTESAVLGAVLLDPPAYWRIADALDDGDFAGEGHARIWQAIRELSRSGAQWDAVTVSAKLRSERLGGQIIELASNAPGSANVTAYAELVARNAEHRRIVAAGQRIAKLGPDDAGEASRILAAAQRPKGAAVRHVSAVLADWHAELERRFAGSEITGLSTGIDGVDAMTSGLQDGDLIVLAARPSMGKSALAGQIAYHAATCGHPALIFSLEMPDAQFANRMIASAANVPMGALRSPQTMAEDAWPRVTAAAGSMHTLPLHFDQTACLSVDQLIARARQIDAQHRLRLIVVDYLQIMQMRSPDKLVQSISEITGALKRLAKELKLPVLLLSQLNRSLESRSDRRPIMSDLRDSGSIEQDADVVAFLYRDEVYNPGSHHAGFAELIFRKQRNGNTGTVPLKSQLQFCRFVHADELPGEPEQEQNQPRQFASRFGRKRAA